MILRWWCCGSAVRAAPCDLISPCVLDPVRAPENRLLAIPRPTNAINLTFGPWDSRVRAPITGYRRGEHDMFLGRQTLDLGPEPEVIRGVSAVD